MTKLIGLLVIFLLTHWMFTWQMTTWKVNELQKIQETNQEFIKHIDVLSTEVDQLKALLQPKLDDPSKWQSLIDQIENQDPK